MKNPQQKEQEQLEGEGLQQEKENVKIASPPLLPLPSSNAGAGLLADLLLSKYLYHIPFHRKIAMPKQAGISLPASTATGWFSGSSDLLRTCITGCGK